MWRQEKRQKEGQTYSRKVEPAVVKHVKMEMSHHNAISGLQLKRMATYLGNYMEERTMTSLLRKCDSGRFGFYPVIILFWTCYMEVRRHKELSEPMDDV